MIIRGILDRSLSNQICIRGFARIKELAKISKANPEYQRELLEKQKGKCDYSYFKRESRNRRFAASIIKTK